MYHYKSMSGIQIELLSSSHHYFTLRSFLMSIWIRKCSNQYARLFLIVELKCFYIPTVNSIGAHYHFRGLPSFNEALLWEISMFPILFDFLNFNKGTLETKIMTPSSNSYCTTPDITLASVVLLFPSLLKASYPKDG